MTAKRVKDPQRNVGRASLLGTGASAIIYLAASAAVMGLVAHHALAGNGAPFVAAFGAIFAHAAWAGKLIAALAVVSGIGALNGWTLVTAEVSRAAANDGLFPKAFGWTDRHDSAWFGIVIAAALPSLLMLWRYTTSSGLTVFTELVDLTVVTVAIPYLFSACAQLTYLVSRRRPVQGWPLARDLAHRRGRRAVLAVGHLRGRLLGRVPGHGRRAGRDHPVRVPQRPPRAGRPRPWPRTTVPGRRRRDELLRAVRGRPAPPGDRAPARPGAVPAHPAEHRRPAVR